MSSLATRIKEQMLKLGMTQESLAHKMGITRGAVAHYLADRRVPPLKQFKKLAAVLKIDPAWLQYGVTQLNKKSGKIIKGNKEESLKNLIPLLAWEQVAEFLDASKIARDEIKEFVPYFYIDKPNWYALRVKGDSMTAPDAQGKSFHQGDIIIVDSDKTLLQGVYVIAILPRSKEATFKQYVIDGGIKYLKPLNPRYPMIEINDSTHICGAVIAHINILN